MRRGVVVGDPYQDDETLGACSDVEFADGLTVDTHRTAGHSLDHRTHSTSITDREPVRLGGGTTRSVATTKMKIW